MEQKTQHQIEMDSYFIKLNRHLANIQLEQAMQQADYELRQDGVKKARATYGRTLARAQALTGLNEAEIWQRIETK